MTSSRRVFAGRLALSAALLASACQDDSNITFDDSNVGSPAKGGSGGAGLPYTAAGSNAAAGDSEGGSKVTAGNTGTAGATTGGTAVGGAGSAGSAASATGGSSAGTAGADVGGTNQGGTAGQGGSAGSLLGEGGMAGVPSSDPITVKSADIDDTHLSACSSDENYQSEDSVDVDGDGCKHEGLIKARFDLPAGALVSEATLKLTCLDASESITISYVTEDWNIATVRWDNRPELGATITTVSCPSEGDVTVDLTAAYQAWLSEVRPSYGIYLSTDHGDGAHFASSEAPQINYRPKLTITYTVP